MSQNVAILLEQLSKIAPGRAKAEYQQLENFLPFFVPTMSHVNALNPDNFLILGGRGAGKTHLFLGLAKPDLRLGLINGVFIKHCPFLKDTRWLIGYGRVPGETSTTFPPPEVIEFMDYSDPDWRVFWVGLFLGRALQDEQFIEMGWSHGLPGSLVENLKVNLSEPTSWFSSMKKNIEKGSSALDMLDNILDKNQNWLFIIYDELDRMTVSYRALASPIRALLSLWLDRWQRWSRIRAKIFLRLDLFRPEFLAFPDASKLKAHQVYLIWSPTLLYYLVLKRMVNVGEKLREYLSENDGLNSGFHEVLGWLPKLEERKFKMVIAKMIGEYMGANPNKGLTYNWIPNHLQDAKRVIMPRPFLKLFSLAAEERNRQGISTLPTGRLLLPQDLRGALEEVSQDRIQELAEEYPWLVPLKTNLEGILVPCEKDILSRRLEKTRWDHQEKPPSKDPEEILRLLKEIGIIEPRQDGRLNVPDIYLFGFGLKRKGGVQKPKGTKESLTVVG